MSDSDKPSVVIGLSPPADAIEHFAATQLRQYLLELFRIDARIGTPAGEDLAVLIGHPRTNACVARMGDEFPDLQDQDYVLRHYDKRGKQGIILAGGSPKATMWAVYELVERLGVTFTLLEDILPADPGPLELPRIDQVFRPAIKLRAVRMFNEHGCSPQSFSLPEQKRALDQLAKMRFNGALFALWPHHPFVHYEFRGVQRCTAELFWGWDIPTDGPLARQLFDGQTRYANPSMPPEGSYVQRLTAGRAYMHEVLAHAARRGITSIVSFSITDFTDEFREAFRRWGAAERKIDSQTWVGHYTREGVFSMGTDPQGSAYQNCFDPVLQEFVDLLIRAHIDEYPEADYYALSSSEFRASVGGYDKAWRVLDERHDLQSRFDLDALCEAARRRRGQRAVNEVQGDLETLFFIDELINRRKVIERSARPDAKVLVTNPAVELYGVMAAALPGLGFVGAMDDYSAAATAGRVDALVHLAGMSRPKLLVMTLTDDNIAVLPQYVGQPTQKLVPAMAHAGLDGYVVRCFMYGEMDPAAAYLARISWSLHEKAKDVLAQRSARICGTDAVDDIVEAFDQLDELTALNLQWNVFGFPVPDMIAWRFRGGGELPAQLDEVADRYRRILSHLERACDAASANGRAYLDYFVRRVRFAIEMLDVLDPAVSAGRTHRRFRELRDRFDVHEAYEQSLRMRKHIIDARDRAAHALEIYAPAVRDGTDRGLFAAVNRYVYEYLDAQATVLEAETTMWSVQGGGFQQSDKGGGAI